MYVVHSSMCFIYVSMLLIIYAINSENKEVYTLNCTVILPTSYTTCAYPILA